MPGLTHRSDISSGLCVFYSACLVPPYLHIFYPDFESFTPGFFASPIIHIFYPDFEFFSPGAWSHPSSHPQTATDTPHSRAFSRGSYTYTECLCINHIHHRLLLLLLPPLPPLNPHSRAFTRPAPLLAIPHIPPLSLSALSPDFNSINRVKEEDGYSFGRVFILTKNRLAIVYSY